MEKVKKLFGDINLTWIKVIIFAIIAGVYWNRYKKKYISCRKKKIILLCYRYFHSGSFFIKKAWQVGLNGVKYKSITEENKLN